MRRWIPFLEVIGSLCFLTLGLVLFFGPSRFFSRRAQTLSVSEQRDLLESGGHARGSRDAKVTVVGFFDLGSEESRSAFRILTAQKERYGNRMRLIFRHLPITVLHRYALEAAQATEAADEQGKFWELTTVIFDQQSTWNLATGSDDLFVQYAELAGVEDLGRFRRDLERGAYHHRVFLDSSLAQRFGLNGSPAFAVNGKQTDVAGLQLAVEKVLSKPE